MQFTAKFAALALAIAPLASAHLIMEGAFPGIGGNNQGPLSDSGSDYPCLANSFSGTAMQVAKGSQAQVSLKGSAVHGGGSCQISITYDATPTKASKFTVIKSFQGGCPISAAGNLPANPENKLPGLPYVIPDDAPAGKAILAWTWFNKIGNREMYMRCAPITITGSAGDKAKFGARPEILKANIGNGCSTKEGTEINFPNPGDAVVGTGSGSPVGNCGPSGAAGTAPASGGAATPATPATKMPTGDTTTGGDDTDMTGPATPATPATPNMPAGTKKPTATRPVAGGSTMMPTMKPTKPATPAKPAGGDSMPMPAGGQNMPATGGSSSSGGACTGSIVCTSATTWAQCSNGVAIPMGPVAAGTKCMNGQIMKRSVARRRL